MADVARVNPMGLRDFVNQMRKPLSWEPQSVDDMAATRQRLGIGVSDPMPIPPQGSVVAPTGVVTPPALLPRNAKESGYVVAGAPEPVGGISPATTAPPEPQPLASHGPALGLVPQQTPTPPTTPAAPSATPAPPAGGFASITAGDKTLGFGVRPTGASARPGFDMSETNRLANVADVAAKENFAAGETAKTAAGIKAQGTQDRIDLLNQIISANVGNQFDGPAKIAAAQHELNSITGQQALANEALKTQAATNAAEVTGRYGLRSAEVTAQTSKEAKIEAEQLRMEGLKEIQLEKTRGVITAAEAKKQEKETEEQKKLADAEVAQAQEMATKTGVSVRDALARVRAGQTTGKVGTFGFRKPGWVDPKTGKEAASPKQTSIVGANGKRMVLSADGKAWVPA